MPDWPRVRRQPLRTPCGKCGLRESDPKWSVREPRCWPCGSTEFEQRKKKHDALSDIANGESRFVESAVHRARAVGATEEEILEATDKRYRAPSATGRPSLEDERREAAGSASTAPGPTARGGSSGHKKEAGASPPLRPDPDEVQVERNLERLHDWLDGYEVSWYGPNQ